MNYYFISPDQTRFDPFQESISVLGDSYSIEKPAQVVPALAENKGGVFFIHMVEPHKLIEEFVVTIRKTSRAALIIHVIEDNQGLDIKKHQAGAAGGDGYIAIHSTVEMVKQVLKSLGKSFDDAPPEFLPKNLDAEFSNLDGVAALGQHPISKEIDAIFKHLVTAGPKKQILKSALQNSGALMSASNKNDDDESGLSLIKDFGEELSLSDGDDLPPSEPVDEGMDLMLSDDEELSLSEDGDEIPESEDSGMDDLSLDGMDDDDDIPELSADSDLVGDEEVLENLGELDLGDLSDLSDDGADAFKLSDDIPTGEGLDLDSAGDAIDENIAVTFAGAESGDDELSEDAKNKLREIDAIMENTSSQIIAHPLSDDDDDDDLSSSSLGDPSESLVSDDLDLDSLDFSTDIKEEVEEKPKKASKKKEEEKSAPVKEVARAAQAPVVESVRPLAAELREISGAYTVEMERAQATISNLRADRDELLTKIQNMEDNQMMHNRQTLTMRAELDEKKIELSIIRKKLTEEIADLKDRHKFHDERRLILEEKNKILSAELEKAGQRNKIDLKKVQMRERELEQKLELLKSDAETQIRHRDLKILELKRKIDAMEFDMESIQVQEKKSVESRFELEDKLEKAIKTLRSAITVLEDETDRDSAMQVLKKNIDI